MLSSNATLDVLLEAVRDIQLSRYLSAVAVTVVVFDWFIVSKIEYQTIWQSRWSVPKFLFYWIRIITLPFIIFASYELMDFRPAFSKAVSTSVYIDIRSLTSSCQAWPAIITVPMFSTFAASNWLFTLRLIALYKRQRVLIWFMRIFYVLTYAASLSMLVLSLLKYRQTADYFPVLKTCGALETSPAFPAMFYAPAGYELLIFALTAYQAYKDASVITTSSAAPFLIVLYRDGLICFLAMLAVRSWNIWIYTTQPISSLNIGSNIFWATNTVLSTRVYLNLVWLVRKPALTAVTTNQTQNPFNTRGTTAGIGMPGYHGCRSAGRGRTSTFADVTTMEEEDTLEDEEAERDGRGRSLDFDDKVRERWSVQPDSRLGLVNHDEESSAPGVIASGERDRKRRRRTLFASEAYQLQEGAGMGAGWPSKGKLELS